MLRLPNLLMSHPAAGMAGTEPIAAINNDLPKTAGQMEVRLKGRNPRSPGCDDQSVDQKD
jgi:hypothetical protein